jgi:hypothetical protein
MQVEVFSLTQAQESIKESFEGMATEICRSGESRRGNMLLLMDIYFSVNQKSDFIPRRSVVSPHLDSFQLSMFSAIFDQYFHRLNMALISSET